MSWEEAKQRAKGKPEFAATRRIRIFLIPIQQNTKKNTKNNKKNRKAKHFYLKNKAIYIFWAT